MRKILTAIVAASALASGPVAAWTDHGASAVRAAETPPAGSIFADLAALGYDLGKFKPDYEGRFPYR